MSSLKIVFTPDPQKARNLPVALSVSTGVEVPGVNYSHARMKHSLAQELRQSLNISQPLSGVLWCILGIDEDRGAHSTFTSLV